MQNNQAILGVIAALLLVIVIFLAVDYHGHHTIGDNIHDAVQDLKR